MKIETAEKCIECKDFIVLETDDFVFFKNKFYHKECFVEKEMNRKRGALSREGALILIEELKNKTDKVSNDLISRNYLYKWIQKKYKVVFMPKYFYEKMEKIFDGSYKGLSTPVPPNHLHDMWKKKMKYLRGVKAYNNRIDNKIEGIGLVNYDLAVVLGSYASYLVYLERKEKKKSLVDDKKSRVSIKSKHKKNKNSVSEIISEV